METVESADGTTIAYDRYGEGPIVILVNGALGDRELDRRFKQMIGLAEPLSSRYTVINYDRRGRGQSTEAGPFAVEREIDDIAALINATGGRASVFGFSSGGALALRAAGAGIGVDCIAVYEVPFMVDSSGKLPPSDFGQRLSELVPADDRGGAVRHFMRNAMGMPSPAVAMMRLMPMWKDLQANAHTLPYDWAALGDHNMHGQPLRADEWSSVTVPALVIYGGKSPEEVHLSRSQLVRAFDAATATSPMAYLRQMRVERMARLLTSTDLSVGQAARAVGWRNQFHASQCFHAAYGLSPTEFRRRGR